MSTRRRRDAENLRRRRAAAYSAAYLLRPDFANPFTRVPLYHEPRIHFSLSNQTVDLAPGDVVYLDTVTASAVRTNTDYASTYIRMTAEETIGRSQIGLFTFTGLTRARTTGTVNLGEFLRVSTTARSLEGMREQISSVRQIPPHAVGFAVSSDSAGTIGFVHAMMFGTTAGGLDTALEEDWIEEFTSTDGGADTAGGGAATERWGHVWSRIGGPAVIATGKSVMRLTGDSAGTASSLSLRTPGGGFATPFDPQKKFQLECRWAQRGTGAGTRRIGLANAALTGDPTDGVYFRHSAAGNITAVVRASSVESTLNSGVAAANGTLHSGRIFTVASSAYAFLDGVYLGTVTGIPPVALGPSAGGGSTAGADGLDVDTMRVTIQRAETASV